MVHDLLEDENPEHRTSANEGTYDKELKVLALRVKKNKAFKYYKSLFMQVSMGRI
jgi:hypothetical protein